MRRPLAWTRARPVPGTDATIITVSGLLAREGKNIDELFGHELQTNCSAAAQTTHLAG